MSNVNKKNILIIIGAYLPGYKYGGPIITIENLVDYLGKEYNFKILTYDRDYGDTESYNNIKVNDWNKVGNAYVFYVPPKRLKFSIIKKLAESADLVYCCGCFNDYSRKAMILKRINKIKVPLVIAAMGQFSPLEFKIKYLKKKTFTIVFNLLGMFKKIYWSLTSDMELGEVRKQIKVTDNYFIAEDLSRKIKIKKITKKKEKSSLKLVWISRIAKKKNLKYSIEILKEVKGNIEFTIYGPIYSSEYWKECKFELGKLPSNIKWSYKGNLESKNVVETLKKYHVFLFPTLGENYGHVIQECLSAGCPIILSDQTPWKDLEAHEAGFVYKLNEKEKFIKAIEYYEKMNQKEYEKASKCALDYAIKSSENKIKSNGYRKIFQGVKYGGSKENSDSNQCESSV